MREDNPYEGSFDQRLGSTICMGNIVSVDAKRRRCRIKTIGMKGVNDDLDLRDVHILQSASHKEGDEETFIPRIGSIAIIAFANSEPYIIGYFQQISQENNLPPGEKDQLQPGDKVTKTKAGNKIIMRSGGSIEIESTKLCRTWFLPNRNLVNTTAQNFELETDGGSMKWLANDETDTTNLKFQIWTGRSDGGQTIEIQAGTTESGAVFSLEAGPSSNTGGVGEKKFHLDIQADGSTTVVVNSKCTLNIDASGNVSIQTEGKISASAKGAVSVDTQDSVTLTSKGTTTVKSTGAMTLETSASMTLKAPGNPVPGSLVTDNFQNIDPITGIPLVGHPKIQVP